MNRRFDERINFANFAVESPQARRGQAPGTPRPSAAPDPNSNHPPKRFPKIPFQFRSQYVRIPQSPRTTARRQKGEASMPAYTRLDQKPIPVPAAKIVMHENATKCTVQQNADSPSPPPPLSFRAHAILQNEAKCHSVSHRAPAQNEANSVSPTPRAPNHAKAPQPSPPAQNEANSKPHCPRPHSAYLYCLCSPASLPRA